MNRDSLSTSASQQGKSRNGFTVTEVLVSLAIIVILLSLMIPAVQRARETARLKECQNKLRQLGVASHQFYSAHKRMPAATRHLYELLPYLDQQPLYEKLSALSFTEYFKASHSVGLGPLTVYACPSDVETIPEHYPAGYRLNLGTSFGTFKFGKFDDYYNGMATGYLGEGPLHLQAVRDGQSNTAFFSERLVEPDHRALVLDIQRKRRPISDMEDFARHHSRRYSWHVKRRYYVGEENDLVNDCRLTSTRTQVWPVAVTRPNALKWNLGATYYHLGQPNEIACRQGPPGKGPRGTVPPTSLHENGVNVLLVDGSLRFIHNGIDQSVWQAIGTRADGDVVSF